MILGLSAAFIGIFYAFFKFGAHRHLRRLRNNISQAQHDQRRNAKRLSALEDKLKVNRSKKHLLEHETQRLQHETDSLYNYLKTSLPGGLHDEVDRCRARSPHSKSRAPRGRLAEAPSSNRERAAVSPVPDARQKVHNDRQTV